MRRQAPRGMSERDVFLVAFLGLGRRAASRIRGGRVGRRAGTGAVALAARLAQAGRWGTPRNRLAHRCRGAAQLVVTRRGGLAAAIVAVRVEELNAIGLNADLRPVHLRSSGKPLEKNSAAWLRFPRFDRTDGGAISKILGALVLRVGGRVPDGSLRYRGMISCRQRRPYLYGGPQNASARLGEQSDEDDVILCVGNSYILSIL